LKILKKNYKRLIKITQTDESLRILEKDDKIIDSIKQELSKPLRDYLKKCYQCARCSGICQISKVQKFYPSRIIQKILEGFENDVLKNGVLWDCLMCNSCLQNCPEKINFADVVRIAKYKMRNDFGQNPDDYTAHKGIYTTIIELMSKPQIRPKRDLSWLPDGCNISNKGKIIYHVGCIPFFKFEFNDMDKIAKNALEIICKISDESIVVLEDEICCGHDIYWGQGLIEEFINLALKNMENFEKTGASTIITACAECYRTFKIDYPNYIKDFSESFEVKHIIEYLYENWKNGNIKFKLKNKTEAEKIEKYKATFTFHDPCRMSRFLPEEINIMEMVREIFNEIKELGLIFEEMEHSKKNALCCGVGSWMNCNERSKALRYKRLSEAKEVAQTLVTSCPKCIMHLRCLKTDYDDFSKLNILDFVEFIADFIEIEKINNNQEGSKQ